jgi:RHS repeat-associated protein
MANAAYAYDEVGRLIRASDNVAGATNTWAWNYDTIGNLRTSERGPSNSVYRVDAMNRLVEQLTTDGVTTNVASRRFLYDAAGNVTNDGRRAMTWDAFDRLATVETLPRAGGAVKCVNTYDSGNRLVKQAVSNWTGAAWLAGPVRTFSYDTGWNLLAEATLNPSAGGSSTNLYTWGLDIAGLRSGKLEGEASAEPGSRGAGGIGGLLSITVISGGTTKTYTPYADSQGSIKKVVDDAAGAVVAGYEYTAYGQLLIETGSLTNVCPFRYSTKRYCREIGLYYYGHRWCDPETARWLSPDPKREEGGLNQYQTFGADPVNKVDPTGLEFRTADKHITQEQIDTAVASILADIEYMLKHADEMEKEKILSPSQVTLYEALQTRIVTLRDESSKVQKDRAR